MSTLGRPAADTERARVRENALYLVFKIVERLATRWRVLNGDRRS